jgi:hypothetical protein
MKDLSTHLLRVAVTLDLLRILEGPLALPVDHSAHPEVLSEDLMEEASRAAIHPVVFQVGMGSVVSRVAMGMGGAEAVAKNQRLINKKRIIWSSSCYLLEVSDFCSPSSFYFIRIYFSFLRQWATYSSRNQREIPCGEVCGLSSDGKEYMITKVER